MSKRATDDGLLGDMSLRDGSERLTCHPCLWSASLNPGQGVGTASGNLLPSMGWAVDGHRRALVNDVVAVP